MAESVVRALGQQLSRRWQLPKDALSVSLRLNPRLTRSIARYRRDRRIIELGPRFFRLRAHRREVLCHELAHAAVDHLHGTRAKPHGSEWRQLVEAAGFRPNARLPGTNAARAEEQHTATGSSRPQSQPLYVYEHRCPVCQMTRRAKRPVRQWSCADCVAVGLSGDLEITRVVSR